MKTKQYEEPTEYYVYKACGAHDSIIENGDAGICSECGTAEDYYYKEGGDD